METSQLRIESDDTSVGDGRVDTRKIKANRSYRIKRLTQLLPHVRGKDFAQGLIDTYRRRHSLTPKQWQWVDKLIYCGENTQVIGEYNGNG